MLCTAAHGRVRRDGQLMTWNTILQIQTQTINDDLMPWNAWLAMHQIEQGAILVQSWDELYDIDEVAKGLCLTAIENMNNLPKIETVNTEEMKEF